MWGGKTEEVALRCKIAKFARKKILALLPAKDKRSERNLEIMLRGSNGLGDYDKLHIHRINTFTEAKNLLEDTDPDLLVMDEIHMLGPWPADFVSELRFVEKYQKRNLRIIISSLDMDFQGKPFEAISLIMAMAHEIYKPRHAICKKCEDSTAYMTHKIPKDGQVNPERIQVGGEGDYEPRCWKCYIAEEKKSV